MRQRFPAGVELDKDLLLRQVAEQLAEPLVGTLHDLLGEGEEDAVRPVYEAEDEMIRLA